MSKPFSSFADSELPTLAPDTHPFELLPYGRRHGRLPPEAEALIAAHPFAAAAYALDVVGGRFEAGEPAIASRASVALQYAKLCLGGPFPAGEPVIAQEPLPAYTYAVEVLNAPFKEGERAIFTDKELTARYCKHFGLPRPKPESFMARLRRWASRYQMGPALT